MVLKFQFSIKTQLHLVFISLVLGVNSVVLFIVKGKGAVQGVGVVNNGCCYSCKLQLQLN